MRDYERSLRARAAAKYPLESRTPEMQETIERKIKRLVQAHQAKVESTQHQAPERHQPPSPHVIRPDLHHGRGYGMER
jgi:hypothetical protein